MNYLISQIQIYSPLNCFQHFFALLNFSIFFSSSIEQDSSFSKDHLSNEAYYYACMQMPFWIYLFYGSSYDTCSLHNVFCPSDDIKTSLSSFVLIFLIYSFPSLHIMRILFVFRNSPQCRLQIFLNSNFTLTLFLYFIANLIIYLGILIKIYIFHHYLHFDFNLV